MLAVDDNEPTDVTEPKDSRPPTNPRESTDLHRTKVPADDPRLKLDRPRSRTLRRGPALLAALAVAGVVVIALIVALSPQANDQDSPKKTAGDPNTSPTNPIPLPDVVKGAPITGSGKGINTFGAKDAGMPGDNGDAARSLDSMRPPSPEEAASAQRAEALRQTRVNDYLKARGSGVFVLVDDAPVVEQQPQRPAPTRSGQDDGGGASPRGQASAEPGRTQDPNMQERKNDFVSKSGATGSEYLEKGLTVPRSPYEVKAGTVIPTVLITGINSDLPGQIVGQVRENVYDTVSGNYLLIPQGSRILAAYDSMVAWGQERVLVCWNRLIRPDGSSISMDCMPGVDLAGYAGFTDEVDNHWWRVVGGAVFSSLLAATAQRSQGDVTGFQPSFPQTWATGAAGQINQTGQQVTQKSLQIQPTITVRPGFSVNVLVSRDMVIPPYTGR